MEEGGFTLVMNPSENMDVDKMLENAKNFAEAPKKSISVKPKKKRPFERNDFYKF